MGHRIANVIYRAAAYARGAHGHITKIGRAHAHGMLVEGAWGVAHTTRPESKKTMA
jgi:hypothetical protein